MRYLSLLVGTLVLAASCGGSSDPAELVTSGERALGTRDLSTAQGHFEDALAAIGEDTSHALYLRAKLGSIEARSASDPDGAKNDLIALSRAMPGKVTDNDFNRIANQMGAKELTAAVAVLAEGMELYPDSEHLDKLAKRLQAQAESSGNAGALDALAGLGYVGE